MADHAQPTRPRDPPSRAWSMGPWVVAGGFVVAAVLALVAPDLRLRAGPLRVSFGDASRLWLQASLAVVAAVMVAPSVRRRGLATLLAVGVMFGAAAVDSTPRRVGDAAEYVAMALHMSQGHAPALTSDRREALEQRLRATPGFEDTRLERPTLIGRDGAQDFHHFWLYSLTVAPWLAMTEAIGWHPIRAFTLANITSLLALTWLLARRGDHVAAALFAAGPIVWWVDKAHAEVFLVVLIACALHVYERRPAIAAACAGAAAAQNPATLPVVLLVAALVWSGRRPPDGARALVALGIGVGVALLHPAYYLAHLARVSPLTDVAGTGVPGLRALVSPLVDPNIGVFPNALPWALVCVTGAAVTRRRERWLIGLTLIALLVITARTPNVNHGGTPGISRYAVWLLAVASPWLCAGLRDVRRRSPWVLSVTVLAAMLVTWSTYRPTLLDRSGGGPSALADALWTHWPALDNPLPEIFGERVNRVDGTVVVPVAVEGCVKALIRGDGVQAWWPFPCEPAPAPPWCVTAGALCYVNQGRFASAPTQVTFGWDPAPERAWTVGDRRWLPALAARVGEGATATPLGRARRVTDAVDVDMPLVVEGPRASAIWLRTREGARPRLRVQLDVAATVDVWDPATGVVMITTAVPRGRQDVPLPDLRSLLVVVGEVANRVP